jgi:hypothetical protein
VTKNIDSARGRLLPTYRWDETDYLSNSEMKLRDLTSQLLIDFIEGSDDPEAFTPPKGIISPIVAMNVHKRSSAMRQAEAQIATGQIVAPPPSLIPTSMASGREIPGVEDGYMSGDHPSQELFAYNRLGKKSWQNKRFGEHCLKAIGFAHPNGTVTSSDAQTRVKAHAPGLGIYGTNGDGLEEWVVISTKAPIATIDENERQAALISRVTGAVDLTSPLLDRHVTDAITHLSERDPLPEHDSELVLGKKALLLEALEFYDGSEDNPFYPVIQTVYLTQIQQ